MTYDHCKNLKRKGTALPFPFISQLLQIHEYR